MLKILEQKKIFIECINKKQKIEVTFKPKDKNVVTRICIPFDYGPSARFKDGVDRFHFYDLNSPEGRHNLSILPMQVIELKLLQENFDPADYITWTPKWLFARDWGCYS